MVELVKGPEAVGWDPNLLEGDVVKGADLAMFPLARSFMAGQPITIDQYINALEEMTKAVATPPSMLSFARMSYMPDQTNSGLMQWPGIPPEALAKIVRENVLPQFVINQRVLDVLRYANLSTHPWRPGWRMELKDGRQNPDHGDRRDMREAEEFILNCNIEIGSGRARERDDKNLTDLQRFLAASTRDTLTFDGWAMWTQMDAKGRPHSYSLLPAAHIRLAPRGYEGDPKIFAVAVDQGGTVVHKFTRQQLVWYVRNPRIDPEYGGIASGYGYSELEMGVRFIQGFQNALDLNVDTFNRSAVPNGILLLKGGGWTQRQLDVLARLWGNLKKGISKFWALPAISTPKDGDLTVLDLQELKDKDVRYQDHMNMVAGGYCTICGFPPRRLGYRISGKGPDAKPLAEDSEPADSIDETDPGLAVLLGHLENGLNSYMIRPRWPNLRMVFTGKNPKEDAREYEAKKNAQTWGEARAEADLPTLEKLAKKTAPEIKAKAAGDADKKEDGPEDGEEIEFLAQVMDLCPIDPNLSGVYQSIVAALVSAKFGGGEEGAGDKTPKPGNRMNSKKDPARSEKHGGTSGVRRNSRAEGRRSSKKAASSLYVRRNLKNTGPFVEWAKDQGFASTLDIDELHVTLAFSREAVDWDEMGDAPDELVVSAGGKRSIEPLGDKGAVVLKFESEELSERWKAFRDRGCSWDHEGYHPHITITYQGKDVDLSKAEPYEGELVFGPERFEPVDEDWNLKVKEAAA